MLYLTKNLIDIDNKNFEYEITTSRHYAINKTPENSGKIFRQCVVCVSRFVVGMARIELATSTMST